MNDRVSLVADIGGTNARFACVSEADDRLHQLAILPCAEFPGLNAALHAYMRRQGLTAVERICVAVAAPIESDTIRLPNNHWSFSAKALAAEFAVEFRIINDFTAQALALPMLQPQQLAWIGTAAGPAEPGAVKAVLGPGTGLGVAALLPSGEVVPSEGGHLAFAPVDEHEARLLEQLWRRFPRLSVERLLSGPGLANLYWANACLAGTPGERDAAGIVAQAAAGDPLCRQTLDDFCAILGSVAGDLALAFGATGGVYLSGGILPRIRDLLPGSRMRARFEDKGRFGEYCRRIPTALVLAEQPGLLGCLAALRRRPAMPAAR